MENKAIHILQSARRNGVFISVNDDHLSIKYSKGKNINSYNQIIDVKDRFGDYGVVGLLLAAQIQNTLVIDTLLLSCRVLGRNVEEVVMAQLQEYCFSKGIHTIIVNFAPTSKNQPFIEFLVRTNWLNDNETNIYSFLINKNQLKLNEAKSIT